MDPAQALEAEILSRQAPLDPGADSEVQRFFKDRTVFVTGGSGFLGKQLIEKLLRSCTVKKVYLLLRPKKGKKIQERLKEILEDPVYSTLRKLQPGFENKILAVQGDVGQVKLGLSDDDWKTVSDEVEIIFHSAATTRFDESLRVATIINVRGTREVVRLAKDCNKLRSFVHVSTAFAHANYHRVGSTVAERFYHTPVSPHHLVELVEEVDPATFDAEASKLIKGWPNTYTFAKAVAEEEIRLRAADLPVCIVRPSIVMSSHYEPTPGWLDQNCAFSASGLILGSGLGIIHVMQIEAGHDISIVPVDYVNNAIIAAAWEVGTRQRDKSETKIYNVVPASGNKINWDMVQNYYKEIREELAMPSAVWLSYVVVVTNYYAFLLLTLLLHFVPAYLADGLMLLIGKKRKFVQLYEKVFKFTELISFFINTKYDFDNKNLEHLYKNLSETDKKIFFFDMREIDWYEFSKICVVGVRKYLIKDGLKNTVKARKRQNLFRIANYIFCALYLVAIWYVLTGFTKCMFMLFNF